MKIMSKFKKVSKELNLRNIELKESITQSQSLASLLAFFIHKDGGKVKITLDEIKAVPDMLLSIDKKEGVFSLELLDPNQTVENSKIEE